MRDEHGAQRDAQQRRGIGRGTVVDHGWVSFQDKGLNRVLEYESPVRRDKDINAGLIIPKIVVISQQWTVSKRSGCSPKWSKPAAFRAPPRSSGSPRRRRRATSRSWRRISRRAC